MRIAVVMALAVGPLSCHRTTAYLNADDLVSPSRRTNDAAPCNDIEQRGADVDLEGSRGTPPTPRGGKIEDGTYVLTRSILYTRDRPDGARLVHLGKVTLSVQGSTVQMVRSAGDGRERRTTVSRESSGTVAMLRTICSSPTSTNPEHTTTPYTASSDSFSFITPSPAGTVVSTYTKL